MPQTRNSKSVGIGVAEVSTEEAAVSQILAQLAALGGNLVQEDALKFQGTEFILPAMYDGDIMGAMRYLDDQQRQAETPHEFNKTFPYRPFDGANAVQVALKSLFGTTGIGQSTFSFFTGETPPQFITVKTGLTSEIQVPWDTISFPPLKATIEIGERQDRELGAISHVSITAPRKYRGHVEGLFIAIENVLQTASIYRGKAITGSATPTFFDAFKVDRASVVYTEDVFTQLDANVWSAVRHSQAMKDLGMALKRTVLLEGPWGTGKSLAANLTAQEAVNNGWTFVFCRPGDDLKNTMTTAALYSPAVVFFEDVDAISQSADPEAVSKLLDLFDGVTNKGAEIVCVLTTNHIERIHKAMLRPGRLDAVIHIGALDRDAFERLVRATVPNHLLDPDLDYDAVATAMEGMMPAFASEAIKRAMRYAVTRTAGEPGIFTTADFVQAAEGLRPQLRHMEEAVEGTGRPALETALADIVKSSSREGVDGVGFVARGESRAMYVLNSNSD